MRLHLLGTPYTSTIEAHAWCAFTQDVKDACTLLTLRGHEIFLYAGPENEARCASWFPCTTHALQEAFFGGDLTTTPIPHNLWDPRSQWWEAFNAATIEALREQIQPGDIICGILGKSHDRVYDAFPDNLSVEWMVGYPARHRYTTFANYTSYAWRNHCEGRLNIGWGHWNDSVIPNPFPTPPDNGFPEGEYLLYLGRAVKEKGLHIANEVARITGRRLLVAGQGNPSQLAPLGERVGPVTGEAKDRLIRHATHVLVPSLYAEPFGKIVVEAQLRGVPAITTDFGAFPETVINGVNGQRCHTIHEFVAAVEADYVHPEDISEFAVKRYAYNPVTGAGRTGEDLERWFARLADTSCQEVLHGN